MSLNDGFEEMSVYVSKESFKFNAAHFIAYKGFRERLHGHNYRMSVRMKGDRIGTDGYVIDFGVMKKMAKDICKRMNEHFIVPTRSDVLDIDSTDERALRIVCEDGSRFEFPKSDVLMLPIVHSSVEEISAYITDQLLAKVGVDTLRSRGIHTIQVSVSEAPGQEATLTRCLCRRRNKKDTKGGLSPPTRVCGSNVHNKGG